VKTDNQFKAEALSILMPNGFSLSGDEIGSNSNDPIPSDSAIGAEIIRIKAEYDAQDYSRNREVEYPSIQECVHAILDDDLTVLQEKRQAVKTKYPKS
jgi:hypothetical protein